MEEYRVLKAEGKTEAIAPTIAGKEANNAQKEKKAISNEMIRYAVEKQTKSGLAFFHKRGFRLYDEMVNSWTLLFIDKVEKIVCNFIMADLVLSSINKLNQKAA